MTPVVPFDSAWAETATSQKSEESTQADDSKTTDAGDDKVASDTDASDEPTSDDPAASDSDSDSPSASEPTDDATSSAPETDAQPVPADNGISPLSDDIAVQSEEDEEGTGEEGEDPENGDKAYTESDFDPSEVGSVFALEHKEVSKYWVDLTDDTIYYSIDDFSEWYGDTPEEWDGYIKEVSTESKYSLIFQVTGENEASVGITQDCSTATRGLGIADNATESAFGATLKASSDLYDIVDYNTVLNRKLIPSTVTVPGSVNVHGTTFNITSVADLAFAGTQFGISEIRLPEGLRSIGSNNTEDTAYTGAFYRNTFLNNVTIPSTVTAIYDSTFYGCTALTEITFPASLQVLGTGEFQTQQVFRNCNNLRTVKFEGTEFNPSQLETFGQGLFRGLNISEVNLGYGMKTTGVEMFYQCDSLTSITLPGSLETIGAGTFRECANLKNIQLPDSLKTIGDYAFAEIDGITGVGDNPNSSFINLRIPTSVETIGANAFMGCSKMIQFNFSDTSQSNLTTIGDRAFYNASSLIMVQLPPKLKVLGTTNEASSPSEGSHVFTGTQIGNQNTPVIPATIESIGAAAFQGCTSLKNVRFANGANSITKLNAYMFQGCTSFVNVYTGRQISDDADGKLPESINEIGDYAFSGTSLKRIDLSTETIGDFVFYNCRSLASVNLNEGIKTLGKTTTVQISGTNVNGGSQVFGECIALASIHIPAGIENYGSNIFRLSGISEITFAEGVTSTGDYMFNNLGFLATVELPASLGTNGGTIGKNMFNNCGNLGSVTFDEGFTTAGDYMFNRCTSIENIQLPSTLTTAGERMFNGCSSLREIEIPCSIEHGEYMFAGSSVSKITFAEGCTSIAPYMLAGLTVSSIDLPDTLTELGAYAFKDCTDLTKITLPASLEVVGERIFDGCTRLANVEFAPGFKVIGPFMFEGFSEMKGITLPNTLIELGEGAFKDCEGLTSITLPASLEIMGKNVFEGCIKLADIKFAPGFKVIGDNMFEGFENLQTIDLPDTLETLGNYAFKDCVNLQSVKLPASLKNVGQHVFDGCVGLETVEFGEGYSVVGAYMFSGLSGLKNITLPNTLTEVGAYAFESCAFVENVDLTKVEKIGEGAFKDCSKITEVNLKSVTEIGADAFAGTNITRLTMPDDPVEGLTVGSFADCKKLVYVNMGGATNVDDSMFEGCDNLETVVLPSVTSIGELAFANCPNLASIDLTNVSSIGDSAFSNCLKLAHINLSSVTSIGVSTFEGCEALTDVDLSNIEAIGAFAFSGCSSITDADLANVISIGDSAFAGTGLASVSLGAGLDEVGNHVFASCYELAEVDLEEGIIVDATHMFADCPNLTTVNFVPVSEERAANFFSAIASFFSGTSSDGLATLGASMFENCAKLSNIELTKVGVIGEDCFKGCSSLTSANLTNATSVHANAFADSGLVDLRMPDSANALNLATMAGAENLESIDMGAITQIAAGTFTNCMNLQHVVMDNVTTIPASTFQAHTTLKSVSINSAQTIGNNAFYGCWELEGISLPAVKSIGNSAFKGCAEFTEITLGDGVSIGEEAFSGLGSLATLTIGDNANIHKFAFRLSSVLTSVTIGDNATVGQSAFSTSAKLTTATIGENSVVGLSSFSGCTSLSKVVLGSGTEIADKSFTGCTNLSDINLEGVTRIGNQSFNGCTKINEVNLTNVTYVSNAAFQNANVTSIIMPMAPNVIDFTNFSGREKIVSIDMGGATEIGENQFNGCTKLATVILRNVDTIRTSAFEGLTTLKQIELAGVKSIGDKAFAGSGLESVTLPGTLGSNGGTVGVGVFEGCTSLASATLGTPETKLASVADSMFKNCTSLASIDLTNVGPVDDSAFQGCTSLADVTIGSVDSIGSNAFDGCIALANIDLSKVKTIGDSAFAGCTALDEVNLDAAIAIEANAFANASIKRLTLPINPAVINFSAFASCTDLEYVDLGGATTVVEAMFTQCRNLSEVKLNNVASIADSAFDGCSKLESADISNVTSIGDYAFRGCELLSDIDLSGVSTVGATAFGGCNALGDIDLSAATSLGSNAFSGTNITSVVLGTGLTTVGSSVFSGCPELASITLPEGMTNTGMFMFSGCNALTSITIPASLGAEGSTIGLGMFQGCENLSDVKLGTAEAPLTIIGNRMFDGCDSLATISLSHVDSIGDSAFANCQQLAEVDLSNVNHVAPNAFHNANIVRLTLPVDTAVIDFSAFEGCDRLEYVDLGGATSIADGVFMACSNLQEVQLRNVKTIGANAFKGCKELATISLDGIESVGDGAFDGCTGLENISLANIKTIGSRAFAGCTGIDKANLALATEIAGDAFSGAEITSLIMPMTPNVIDFTDFDGRDKIVNIDMGAAVEIGPNQFKGCESLENVVLHEVTTIGAGAFEGLSTLKHIDLAGVSSIGNRAFAESGLESVVLPANLGTNGGTIGTGIFEDCTSLASATLGTAEVPLAFVSDNMFKGCTALVEIDLTNAGPVGASAFQDCTGLTDVTLGGVEEISANAFNGCTSLANIELSHVKTIGENAFNRCVALNVVNLNAATSIQHSAFANASIIRLTLPDDPAAIDFSAFASCTDLEYVDFGGATSIADGVFMACSSLREVQLHNVKTIGANAFKGCKELATISLDGIESVGDGAFDGCTGLKDMNLANIKEIGSRAFADCSGITEANLAAAVKIARDAFNGAAITKIVMPTIEGVINFAQFDNSASIESVDLGGLTTIADSMFVACTNLNEVELRNVTKIGNNAFDGCAYLTTIDLTGVESIGNRAFAESGLESVIVPGTLGDNEGVLGTGMFEGCSNLASVEFGTDEAPFSMITDNMFKDCTSLSSIDLHRAVSIGNNAFDGCIALSEVTVPSTAATIGDSVFANCTGITEATLGSSTAPLTTVASNMFNGCTALRTVDLVNVETINAGAFNDCAKLEEVNLTNATSIAEGAFAGTRIKRLTLPLILESVAAETFKDCDYLQYVNLGGVKEIGARAFVGCEGLASVVFNNVETIGEAAFENCATLASANCGSVETISNSAFKGCKKLARVDLGNVTSLGTNAFNGCTSIEMVSLSDGLESVSDGAFEGCTALTSVQLPGATSVGNNAFKDCTALATVGTHDLAHIGDSAFEGCSALFNLDCTAVETIGDNAFKGCDRYRNGNAFELPVIKSIGNSAFEGTNFSRVTIKSLPESMGDAVFRNCAKLALVTVPEGITITTSDMFAGCGALTTVSFMANGGALATFGPNMFAKCANITDIDLSKVKAFGDGALDGCSSIIMADLSNVEQLNVKAFPNTNFISLTLPRNGLDTLEASHMTNFGTVSTLDLGGVKTLTQGSLNNLAGLETVNINSVASIDEGVFTGSKTLKTVYNTSGSLKNIGASAFENCTALATFGLRNVLTIGDNAFKGCKLFGAVSIDKATSIGSYAFASSGVTKLEIYESLVEVGEGAFSNCGNLSMLSVNSNSALSADKMFSGCSKLSQMEISSTVTLSGNNMFENCTSLATLILPTDVTVSGDSMFVGCSSLATVDIDSKSTVSGNHVFENCSALSNLMFGPYAELTGESLFKGCTSLVSVELPLALKTVTYEMFMGCASLTSVVAEQATLVDVDAFKDCKKLESFSGNQLVHVQNGAFENCFKLNKVATSKVTDIGDAAFKYTTDLQVIDLTMTERIGESAFEGSGIKHVVLGAALEQAGDAVFSGCLGLVDIILGEGTHLESNEMFMGCSQLGSVTFGKNVQISGDRVFAKCVSLNNITVEDDDNVTIEGDYVFSECTALKSVKLPKSLMSGVGTFKDCTTLADVDIIPKNNTTHIIASRMFENCVKLNNIDLSRATSIGESAFEGCGSLRYIDLTQVQSLADRAFKGCGSIIEANAVSAITFGTSVFVGTSLERLSLSENLKELGPGIVEGISGTLSYVNLGGVTNVKDSTFENFALLETVDTTKVENIGTNAFSGCAALKTIDMHTIKTMGENAFASCSLIEDADLTNLTQIVASAFENTSIKNLILPAQGIDTLTSTMLTNFSDIVNVDVGGATKLDAGAFENCADLTNVKLNNVDTIDSGVFNTCAKLASIDFGNVKTIGQQAFRNCKALSSLINFAGVENIGSNAFDGCTALTELYLPTSIKSVGGNAFSGCSGITSLTFEEGYTTIGQMMFNGCAGLTKVELPGTLTNMPSNVFNACTALTDVVLGTEEQPLTTISASMFNGCSNLSNIDLSKVETIESEAFKGCISLRDMDLASATSIGRAFLSETEVQTLTLSENLKTFTREALEGCTKLQTVDFGGVEAIDDSLFANSTSLRTIVVPTAMVIGNRAFSGCTNLANITLPDGCAIGEGSFRYCSKIAQIDLTNISSIGASAFESCEGLTNVDIAQATSIGANAFNKCSALANVTIGAAESIGNGAFAGTPITSISLPSTLGANDGVVGANIFQNCLQLTTVDVAEEITSIAEGMFKGCDALSTINMDNIQSVGADAFNGCQAITEIAMANIANVGDGAFAGTNITSAVLPSLQAIGAGAFENCSALTAVDLSHVSEPGFVLGKNIFKGCSNLEDLTLSSNLTELGTSAFQGADKLAVIKFKGESANNQTSIPPDGFATAGATNLEKLVFYGTLLIPSNSGNSNSEGDADTSDVEGDGETTAPSNLFGGDSVKTYVTVYYYDSLENLGADEEAGTYDKAAGYVCVPYHTKLGYVPAQHVEDIFDSSNYYGEDEPCILNFDYDAVFTSGGGEPKVASWEYSDDTTRGYYFDTQLLAPQIELEDGPLYYTGEEVKPLKKVSLLGFELKPEQYRVTYENNVDAGEATVTVSLLISGASRGSTTQTFTIEPADMEGVTVAPIAQQSYIGEGIEPELEVTFGEKTLEPDVDYTVAYADNVNVGEATVTLTGVGNFSGETSATFEIVQGVISNGTIEPLENVVYNGKPNQPTLNVKMFEGTRYEKTLTAGVDYTVEYENNVNVGVATATIKGEGGYMGELSTTFNIVPKEVSDTELSEIEEQVYTGLALEPEFTLYDDERGANLVPDVDYTVTYSNTTQTSSNIGKNAPSINIKGKGNYTGSISVKFAIVARDIKDAAVSGLTDVTYTGMAFTPTPKVVLDEGTDNERDLYPNRQYIIEYQNNTDAGTATIVMKGIGDYTGTVTANFQIHPKSLDSATLSQIADQIYAAEPIEPAFTVSDGAKTLVADRDYTVEYVDNTNVGEATVTVTGINNYVGKRTLSFNILARDIASADIAGYEDVIYNGSAYTPALDISFDKGNANEKNLAEGTDYTVAFSNNVNVGTATAVVTGIGGYTGTQTITFDIARKSILSDTVELVMTDTYTYRGSEITPDARLIDGERNGTALVRETDFKVSYENNLDAAAADSENPPTVKIEGTGNYTGEKTVNFTIMTRNIDNAEIAGVEDTVYNRAAQKPVPIVKLDSGTQMARVLNADTDYTVTYSDNTDAGNATVTIRGTGNYSGTAQKTFQIAPKSITRVSITKPDDQTYTGDAMRPEIVVSDGDDVLVEDDEYKISYDSNTAVGVASVTVTGKGNYTDSKTLEFNIKSRSISDAQVAGLSDVVYTGEEFTPEVVVAVGLKRLVLDTDYTVAYSDNKNAGEAKVTISGMGGYSGQATATFRITPKSVQTIDVAALTDVTYTGDQLEPEVVLTDQERDCALELGTDYELVYSNNTNAATATSTAAPRVTINGKGNYQGSRNVTFTIAPRSIEGAVINNVGDVTYNGTAFKPEPVVVLNAGEENEKTLLKNSEYTVEYVDNQNAGDATVIVHGIGNYTGSASKGFNIARKDISTVTFAEIPAQTYTGEQLKPVVGATDGTMKLVEGADFTVGYDNNVSVGKATVTVTGQGNYTGTQTLNFDINKQSIKGAKVMSVSDATYTGSPHTPEPVVILNGKVLAKETDYVLSYDNNLNAGNATVIVTGVNGYSDSESLDFTIARKNIASGDVSVTGIDPATYTGEAITPAVSITDTSRDVALTPQAEFSVEFENNVDAATISDIKPPTATITGEGNYTGTRSVTFTIAPRTIDDVVITGVDDVIYSGNAFEPEPTVELGGDALKKGTDYTVSYANNTNVGTATVTITGIGNYQGTKDATFEIGGKDLTALDAPVIADQAYTGSAIEPVVSIMDGKKELVKDIDYTVSFTDNVNVADTPAVTIVGAGNYVGTISTTFNIVPRAISSEGVRLQIASGNVYTGEQLAPAVNVTDMIDGNEVALRQDVDYTLTYTNNISAADADSYRAPSVTITGMGNYKGTQKGAFTIEPKDVESVTIEAIDDQSYAAGDEITPKVVVKDGELTLKLNTDYEIDYADNTNVGTAKISVIGIGNYAGTKESSFEIVSKDITKVVMASFEPQIYNGQPIEPEITLLDGNKTLEKDVDFKMDFTENTNAGMASATISGIGNYSGSRTVRFLISSKPLAGVEIADIPDEVYDGAAHMPRPVVTIDNMTLKEGTDYALSYSSNVNCGTAAITITGIGNYSGVASSTFEITQCSIDDASIGAIPNETYTMNTDHTSVAHEPSPVVTIGNRRLVKDIEYDLSYENNTQAGKATVKVTGKGNYKGEVEANFTIDPRDISNAFISPLPDQNMIVGGNTPLPTVNVDGIIVTHDVDFVVEYKNNTDVGEATLTVKGIGNYKGQKAMTFNIIAAPFDFNTKISIEDPVYTGIELTPEPTVSIGTKVLEMDKDYVVEYADNINAGPASLTIYGIGSYSGSKTAKFNITARPLSSEGIDFLDIEEQVYAGGSYIRPEIKLSDRGKILDESDFYVSYSNNRDAGSATVSIVGAGNYQGNIKTNFTIAPKPVTDDDVSVQILESSAFTGEAQKPQVVVKWGNTTLNEGVDYELEYVNNVNAATVTSDLPPTIIVRGKGNYGDEKRVLFTIFQKSLSKATISGLKDTTYTGAPISCNLTVKLGDVTLVEGDDYEVTYDNTNVDAGIATATVHGINNYQDTVSGTFKIAAKSLAGSSVASIPNQPYTGAAITPEVTITNGDLTLVKDKDFTISKWTNNTNAGTASFTVIGIGNYTGTLTSGKFTIVQKNLSDCTGSAAAQTYTGGALTPVPTLKNGDATLVQGTDFTVVGYSNNVNVGTSTITVKGQGNYTGEHQVTFAIGAKAISTATITPPAAQEYTGAALSPRPTVKNGSTTLTFGVDYTLTWSNNVNVGTGTVTIAGKGNYTGTANSTFAIKAMDISSATVGPIASMIYTGSSQSPAVALTNGGKALVQGKDFEVSYDNNVNAGNANVVITGKGNYAGTLGSSFVITKGTDTITGGTKSKSFKAKALKKKKATFKIGAKGNGTLKYKAAKYVKVGKITAAKAKKAVKIATNGTVTVNKKTAKGTYKVEVTITSTGNPNLNGGTLKLVLQVNVK